MVFNDTKRPLKGLKVVKLELVSDSEIRVVWKDVRGITRYSARFCHKTNGRVKVFNKLRHDERGMSVERNISIPDSIFNQMIRGAYGFFCDRAKRRAAQ